MQVNVWLNRLRTESTREAYGRWLNIFTEFAGVSSEETLEWDAVKAEDMMLAFKDHLLNEGLSGNSVKQAWSAVKRWFDDNRIKVAVKCKDLDTSKTYLDYIPTKDDIRQVLYECPLKYKIAVSLIAFSGMRPIDVQNLQYENIKASYERNDPILTLVLKQRKTNEWYFTFLGPQGTKYIRDLLTQRAKDGETITDKTYIVSDDGSQILEPTFKWFLKEAIKRSTSRNPTGESFRHFRSYGFRKYFRRVARKLGEDTAEFLMGHIKGIKSLSAVYVGLKDLDPRVMEEIKKDYAKLLPELETELSEESVSSELDILRRRVQEMERFNRTFMGWDPSTIEKFQRFVEHEQRQEMVLDLEDIRRQEIEEQDAYEYSKKLRKRPVQKVILESELEDYINKGWIYVNSLNNGSGKCIIESARR